MLGCESPCDPRSLGPGMGLASTRDRPLPGAPHAQTRDAVAVPAILARIPARQPVAMAPGSSLGTGPRELRGWRPVLWLSAGPISRAQLSLPSGHVPVPRQAPARPS